MDQRAKDFLYELLMTPAPSGSEGAIQQVIADHLEGVADTVEADLHGNLILGLNTSAPRKVLLAGHCDQIGFMVVKIDDTGFLLIEAVGGTDEGVVPGSRVVVLARDGPLDGVFGKKPIHLQDSNQSATVATLNNVWIDIGAKDRGDAERRVSPGDYVVFKPGVVELLNGRVSAPSLDNRAGLFAVLEAFRLCAESAVPDEQATRSRRSARSFRSSAPPAADGRSGWTRSARWTRRPRSRRGTSRSG